MANSPAILSISTSLISDVTLRLTNQLLDDHIKPQCLFSHFLLAMILEKCYTKMIESTIAFFKSTQIKER